MTRPTDDLLTEMIDVHASAYDAARHRGAELQGAEKEAMAAVFALMGRDYCLQPLGHPEHVTDADLEPEATQ